MAPESTQKLSLFALTAMVVGGMVGAGIFSLPRTFAGATGPFGAIIAWLIAGTGMYMLARVFQSLAERKPDLDAGVFAYAKAGFGDYPGFLSAFGYWIGSCIGNVSYWVLIKSTLGAFFPVFGDGNTVIAIIGRLGRHLAVPFHDPARRPAGRLHQHASSPSPRSCRSWSFIVILIFAFKLDLFSCQLLRRRRHAGKALFEQVRATMLVTVFVFLGIEGASVYSRLCQEALGRGHGHHPGLYRRDGADGAGHAAALCGAAARRYRRHAAALHGRRCSRRWSGTGVRCSSASAC